MNSTLCKSSLLFLLLLFLAAPALAQDEEQAWRTILQKNSDDVVQKANDFSTREKSVQDEVRELRQQAKLLEKKLSQMSVVTSLPGQNPFELKAALSAVGKLKSEAEKLLKPHIVTIEEFKKLDSSMAAFEQEFAKLSSEIGDPQIAPVLEYYRKYVAGARTRMARSMRSLDQELTPASQILGDIKDVSGNLSGKITRAWQDYYYSAQPSPLTITAWRNANKQAQSWFKNLTAIKNLALGDESLHLTDIANKIILICFVFTIAWLTLLRKFKAKLAPKSKNLARKVYIYMALGLCLAYASTGAPLLLYDLITSLSEICLALAVSKLCWALRPARPEEDLEPNPLTPLTFLFGFSVLLNLILPPGAVQAGTFILVCLPLAARLGKIAPRISGRYVSIAPVSRYYCIILVLLTLTGWLNLAVLILAGYYLFLMAGLAGMALHRWLKKIEFKLAEPGGHLLPLLVLRGFGYPLLYLGLFLGALYWFCTRLGGQDVFFELIFRQTGTPQVSFSLWRGFLILAGFYLCKASVAASQSFSDNLAARRQAADRGSSDILRAASTYGLWVVYGLISLYLLGIDMASLAVVAGGLSVGIGFGLQNVVNNFVAGLILLFGRAIQTGDSIQIGDTVGTVTKVNIRNTIVQTGDNATLFVPNSELIGQKLLNWTHKDPRIKREIPLRVAYGSDVELVKEILLEVAANQEHVLKHPAPAVFFHNFGETALEFSLAVWFDNMSSARRACSDMRSEIYRQGRLKGLAFTPAGPA